MKCFGNTENGTWQDRLHRIRNDFALLATEDADLIERHVLCRIALHQIEQRQKQIEEQRQQLQTEITAIETELGLTISCNEK